MECFMKKRITVFLMAAVIGLSLAGCGNQIPELSREDLQKVGDYVAITVMKYNNGSRSRLVDLPPETNSPGQKEESGQPGESGESGGMRPTEDTPIVNPSGDIADGSLSADGTLGLPDGVRLEYQEYEVCDSYTYREEGEDIMSLNAAVGKKLLVLHFSIANDSGQDQDVDLQTGDRGYQVTVNGSYQRRALFSMMPDDMTSLHKAVSAGGSEKAILLIEVDENMAGEISSISLKIKNESKICTIQIL